MSKKHDELVALIELIRSEIYARSAANLNPSPSREILDKTQVRCQMAQARYLELIEPPSTSPVGHTPLAVAAAILQDGTIYSLPAPARHHNVMDWMVHNLDIDKVTGRQGFLMSDGRFFTRRQAKAAAEHNNQMLKASSLSELFSEDLW